MNWNKSPIPEENPRTRGLARFIAHAAAMLFFVVALTVVGCGLGDAKHTSSSDPTTPTTPTTSPTASPTASVTLSSKTPSKNTMVTATVTGPASTAFVLTVVSSNAPTIAINGTPISGSTNSTGSGSVTFNSGTDAFQDDVTVEFQDTARTTATTSYTPQ